MSRPLCWIIENYEFRPCNNPSKEFRLPVSLHGHSYHSEEGLGRLNYIMQLPVLKQIHNLINHQFRMQAHDELDYSDFHYCPPISPEQVYELEKAGVAELGWDDILLALTDHDKIAACHELIEARPELKPRTSISEELSILFEDQVIHLGVHGIPLEESDNVHKNLQDMAQKHDHDGIFELLHEKNCLVIFNHPLWHFRWTGDFNAALKGFLKRYRWAIDAFEFNGLRKREENDRVIDLAKRYQRPLIGAGDRHTPIRSVALTATLEAETFADFIEEVKSGHGVVICTNDYFFSHGWKLFVRILQYVQTYRNIVFYKKMPLTTYPIPDRIFPDTVADFSRFLIRIFGRLNLIR